MSLRQPLPTNEDKGKWVRGVDGQDYWYQNGIFYVDENRRAPLPYNPTTGTLSTTENPSGKGYSTTILGQQQMPYGEATPVKTPPSVNETAQMAAQEAAAEERSKQRKRRGRRLTILTSGLYDKKTGDFLGSGSSSGKKTLGS